MRKTKVRWLAGKKSGAKVSLGAGLFLWSLVMSDREEEEAQQGGGAGKS